MSHRVPSLPEDPGVRYRSVPRHSNYLVGDNGKVYMSRRTHWREMKPHKIEGKLYVWLMNDVNPSGEDVCIEDLVKEVFR